MLQIQPDAGPGGEAAAHRIDQHIRRLEVRHHFGVA
jgi:hypothetical protein